MIDLCSEYLSIWCIWLYVLIMSRTRFRFCVRFEQGFCWHSGSYGVWIHSEMHTWHDKNIQSNAPYRSVLTIQPNHLASLAKWLSASLWTKCLWVRVQFQSLRLQISLNFLNQFCLGCISLKGNIYYFLVDYDAIGKSDILNIRRYLMFKNNIK